MSAHADFVKHDAEISVLGGKFVGTLKWYAGVTDHFGTLVEDEAVSFTDVEIIEQPVANTTVTSSNFDEFFEVNYDVFADALYEKFVAPSLLEML